MSGGSPREMLFKAAKEGDVGAIQRILGDNLVAKIWKDKNSKNATALMHAAENGRLAAVIALTAPGDSSLDHKNDRGSTALMFACRKGFGPIAQHLLECTADPNAKNAEGTTPLMVAAWGGHLDICRLLVKFSAKLDDTDIGGNTALMLAATAGQQEACRVLLSLGADKSLKNAEGKSAAELAKESEFPDLAAFIDAYAPRQAAVEQLFAMASKGDFTGVIAALEADNELINTPNARGSTLLMFASQKGDAGAIRRLIELGADYDAVNKNKTTALMSAAVQGNAEAVEALLDAGANKWAADIDKLTAVEFADQNGHKALADGIRNYVRKVTLEEEKNKVIAAASKGNFDQVILAIEKSNGLIAAVNANGSTLLMYAAQAGEADIVRKLLALGAEINAGNKNDTTALMTAAAQGHADMVKILLEAGADKELTSKGMTAAELAEKHGFGEVAAQIRNHLPPPGPSLEDMLTELKETSKIAAQAIREETPALAPAPKVNPKLTSLTERLKRGGLVD